MQIIMASRHTKTSFATKILILFHSKNSLFYLFIFLIGLPIGFVCSFYLQSFSTAVQTSIFTVSHSLSLLPPHGDSIFSLTPPPLTSNLPQPPLSLSLSLSPVPNEDTFSSLTPPPLSPPPLPNEDTLSSLAPPQLVSPPPLTSNLLQSPPSPSPNEDTLSSFAPPPQVSPPPLTSNLPQPLLSQPHADTPSLSPSSEPPAPPPSLRPSVSITEQIPMMHNMSDEDLVKSVMEVSKTNTTNTPYKVAFMFLTPGPLPLSPLWELFFKGHESLFSIYVHPHPSYNDTIPQDSVFYGTTITSQPVYWGDISMIDAERRLLANALLDPLNRRFVLLSDSCIPLFNFTTTYSYLGNSNLSYIASFDDKRKSGRGRYNPQMSTNITIEDWRKGSQWFEVNRDLALEIVVEQNYYSLFKEYCHPPCYSDEHYLPTLVNILYGRLNSNRTITHVDWSIAGPHPRKYMRGEITEELLNSIKFGSTECVYNDNMTPMCVLFARKFTPGTLNSLLMFAPLLFGTNS